MASYIQQCPKCKAPFEQFLPRQVYRSFYGLHLLRAWILGLSRPGYWAVICRACKEIVAYEQ